MDVEFEVECGDTAHGDTVVAALRCHAAECRQEQHLRVDLANSSLPAGDVLAVAGSWDWHAPPRPLEASSSTVWEGKVPVVQGSPLEYKYLILKKDGGKEWEILKGNRVLQPLTFAKIDDKPQFESRKSKHACTERHGNGSGNNGSVITGEKSTIYGKVCLDYGTLEQRMQKRMNQPVNLDGDRDQQENFHGRSAPKARLEDDWTFIERTIQKRAAAWPQEQPHAMPPSTTIEKDSAAAMAEIVAFEGRNAVTLCERFTLAKQMLERAPEGSAVPWTVFVWLRFSSSRQLTWQRKSNTRPFLLSQATEALSELVAQRLVERPKERLLWRLILTTVPRGGSGDQGQAIRDDILTIMQRWQLKKRKGDFMEQWHQKLHNNTTPDDIRICEAYLKFLRSNGDIGEFYGHLEEHGISRERLQTFERPILQEPVFFPTIRNGLINDFEKYLIVLKNVHAGADLEKSVDDAAHRGMDGSRRALCEAILAERDSSGDRIVTLLEAVAEARSYGAHDRSTHYLDVSLENHSRLLAERLGRSLNARGMALCCALCLENLCRSVGGPNLRAAYRDFVASLGKDGNYETLRASATTERALGAVAAAGNVFSALQARAEEMGEALRKVTPEQLPASWAVDLFAEECIRGGAGFAASLLLSAHDRCLRSMVGGSPWQLVSRTTSKKGRLHVVAALKSDQKLAPPSIVLAEKLGGEEDPPEGTVAVITPNAVDVLSHVAVRARTTGIFLATCFDDQALSELRKLDGCGISITEKAGTVVFSKVAEEDLDAQPTVETKSKVKVVKPTASSELWVRENELATCKQAGAKSKNLAALRAGLPEWIHQPQSGVVPFGVLDRVMSAPENSVSKARYESVIAKLQLEVNGIQNGSLNEIRDIIKDLTPPESLFPSLQSAMEGHGASSVDKAWWQALTSVWASSWSDRAVQACNRCGIQPTDVAMAVLVQRLIPAEYSFVVHTVHPTGSPDKLYAEVVVGLGEVLVGNYAGRALGFTANRDGSGSPELVTLPSKGVALRGSGLIFRSDSNAEDLEDFAGAGLFDSVPVQQQEESVIEYSSERLVEDSAFRIKLLSGIAKLAMAVEKAAGGSPQDIEGCYANGEFFVVQTRPQA
eukprot:TRINITY_DN793_c0_g1_i2.p1 TRINITY_DN793_c0_g1~~TRINITY_DN793_c0_g1_i2.p1  ORF type:complete len:1138 (-),score=156.75 TRINITY_DN793_c0_g1_i2:108-3443(-)